ncbi:hypothetical protein Bbelb_049220 [Branchiostoma belcheri]|nr:hypothetical protein Bbelb_049220 [Branchiostoma belcheri]
MLLDFKLTASQVGKFVKTVFPTVRVTHGKGKKSTIYEDSSQHPTQSTAHLVCSTNLSICPTKSACSTNHPNTPPRTSTPSSTSTSKNWHIFGHCSKVKLAAE